MRLRNNDRRFGVLYGNGIAYADLHLRRAFPCRTQDLERMAGMTGIHLTSKERLEISREARRRKERELLEPPFNKRLYADGDYWQDAAPAHNAEDCRALAKRSKAD